MEKEYKYMVATRCFTFTHAPFIEDTLRGFAMQKTTFPVVFLIVDDASQDGEPDVLRQWADSNLVGLEGEVQWSRLPYGLLTTGSLRNNPNLTFVFLLLAENHYSKNKPKIPYLTNWLDAAKYHAVCEGDDYWICEDKLQIQVDFMETHHDYTLCFHSVYEKYEGRPYLDRVRSIVEDREYSGIEWYKHRPSQFASFLFRAWVSNSAYYKSITNSGYFIAGDVPLLISCSHLGKIRGISKVMSVYRRNETGWTQTKHSKETKIKIAESELHFSVFGEEFKSQGESFYCLALVRAFVNTIVHRGVSIDYDYLRLAWKKSKRKTVKSFFVVFWKYAKKFFKL